MGESEIIDELRVIISEQAGTTAYFTFSSQMRPDIHEFRIYGTKNGLIVDQDSETLIKLRGDGYKSYLQMFVPPVDHGTPASRKPESKSRNVSGERLSYEIGHEVSDRSVLSFDCRRHACAHSVSRNSADAKNHGRDFRSTRLPNSLRVRRESQWLCILARRAEVSDCPHRSARQTPRNALRLLAKEIMRGNRNDGEATNQH